MENIYHRYINLPFDLVQPNIVDEMGYPDHPKHQVIFDYDDGKMNTWLETFGVKASHIEVFYTPPGGGKIPAHTDLPALDNRVKINMTWGPDNGTIRWWKVKDEQKLINSTENMNMEELASFYGEFTEAAHQNLLAREEDCDMVYEAVTNTPSLVNVGQLHSTYNPGDYGRWTLCFHLSIGEDFLDWHKAQEVFKDYLV